MNGLRLFVLMLVPMSGFCASAKEWTYAECVEYARQHNISLQKSRLNEDIADLSVIEAKAQWQPTLDFATTHNLSNTPWADDRKTTYNSSYGLNAGWTIWNGGIRENTIKQNNIKKEQELLTTIDLARTIETDLLSVYLNILYARENIEIYERTVELSKAQADRSKALMDAGRASKVDYAQLCSQYEQDCYALVNARGVYATRCMELKKLLELSIDDTISVAMLDWTADQILSELPPMSDSYALALDTDAQIKALALNKDAADLDISIAKAGHSPKISLNAGVGSGYYAPGNGFGSQIKRTFNESLGVTLSIPILDNKKAKVAVAKARAQKIGAQLDISTREIELAQLIESWYIDVYSAQSRFRAAEEQVKAAEISDNLVNEQFRLGLVNPVELMSAHNTLLEARHSRLQAKYMAILGKKMIEFYRTTIITM